MKKTKKKIPKLRDYNAAKLAANRKAFGQAGPITDKRKEQNKKWARNKNSE